MSHLGISVGRASASKAVCHVQIPLEQLIFHFPLKKMMFRFVVLPCFDLALTVPMYSKIHSVGGPNNETMGLPDFLCL